MNPQDRSHRAEARGGREGLTRREFLGATGGLLLLFTLAPESAVAGAAPVAPGVPADLNAWLRVGPKAEVTVFTGAVELGQGVRTALAQMVAEELTFPVAAVKMVMGDVDRAPSLANIHAEGTIATVGVRLREVAAEAREMLAHMAAQRWGVSREAVTVVGGRAVLPSATDTSVALGELAQGQPITRRATSSPALTPQREHRVIGQRAPRTEGPALVTGEAKFVADLRLPGMAYGKVLRPPCLGAQLMAAEVAVARAQPGVLAVVSEGGFVGVVAVRGDVAERALRLVQATWREADHPSMTTLFEDLRRTARPDGPERSTGNTEAALTGARHGFSASYRAAFVAHAPIEPHGAVAAPGPEGLTIYASTPRPQAHREAVAAALALPLARVRVVAMPVGGAFGGKDAADVSIEAARLATAAGCPVMLTQSRREELAWNYFRPAALIDLRCGVSAAGRITAWDCAVFNCGARGADPGYSFPNLRVRSHRCDSPLRPGHWRGDGGPLNTFAREVHLDYAASQLGIDPIAFRLRHLDGSPRLAAVVRAAAERYGWRPRQAPTGLGVGFACAADSGTCVAHIVEVEVAWRSGEVRVRRVTVAQDSGLVVNPDGLRSQIEGAVVMGLGFTLREAVRYEQGRILTDRFASYPIPTLPETPDIDVVLVSDGETPPKAAGEPAIFPVAAAVANAIFDATGKRFRELPISPDRVAAALRS